MNKTCRQRCIDYLRRHEGEWVASGTIQRLGAEQSTYTPSNISRRLREAAQDGEIEVQIIRGHAHYRWVNEELKRKQAQAYFDSLPDRIPA